MRKRKLCADWKNISKSTAADRGNEPHPGQSAMTDPVELRVPLPREKAGGCAAGTNWRGMRITRGRSEFFGSVSPFCFCSAVELFL